MNSNVMTVDETEKIQARAWRLALVVYLLQALHVLFGITAIIGMLINHTNGQHVRNTLAESHFKWQIFTFWIAAAAYAVSFYLWIKFGLWETVLLVLLFVSYRILRGWWQLAAHKPVNTLW